ncbi:uncharacterized protein QC761_121960 [Podospora bellae-mahoneyi]|uniref:FAD-binding PCMH-type domain-containing protein n=1 Tax=Podospora bellae-mahoneyi TaxID=2093777 RepID=A0ABR0FTJ1_9PEZI|nr:hypothetical protein QC761_121960 [Podospora bellae-mahoneyi]
MPPTISLTPATLKAFFDDVALLIGEDNVSRDHSSGALTGALGQTTYGDAFSKADTNLPAGAVRPETVQEVQEIVKLANKHQVYLWTVSRGKNLGYGGTGPVVKGTVVLDLHRMTQIIEINEEYGYAIAEPGVSFFDLYEEIQRRGLKLWPSVPAIGWGSVVGNTLDRGFGYTPNGEHSQSQCGMEVVLPDGTLLRTGSGAMSDNATWALYKGGFGPSLDGLFYQSNLGIVTKIGIHITPAPEAYATVEVDVPLESDLIPLVGTLSDLMRRSIILNSPSIANIFRIALTSEKPEVLSQIGPYMKADSCVPYDLLERIRVEERWGFWRAYFSLYGSVEMLSALKATVERAFRQAVPGVQFKYREWAGLPGAAISAAEDIKTEVVPHSGIPTVEPLGIVDSRGERGGGHICFSPVIPPSGRELYDWYLAAKKRTADAKFDFFADFHVYPRYVIAIDLVIYTMGEEQRLHELYKQLLHDAGERRFMEYRTHVGYMDTVASKLDFNDFAFGKFVQTLKDTFDPNGVLSPGKSGIWVTGQNM